MCVTNNKEENKMANNFNIQFGVSGNYYVPTEKKEDKSNNGEQAVVQQGSQAQIANKDVLNYMAVQNMDIVPQGVVKNVDVTKYVTPAQEARIAAEFGAKLDEVDTVAVDVKNEIPGITEEAATSIAAKMVFNV